MDHNGNQVPDGTIVRFMLYHAGENTPSQIIESQTSQGTATGNLMIDQSGEINIRAESGQALTSDILSFEIPSETSTETPPVSTQTQIPTYTPTLSPTDTPTSTPVVTVIPENNTSHGSVNFGDWLAALLVTAIVSGGNYWIINIRRGLRWGVRAALLPLIGGMFTYTYLAINLPGSDAMTQKLGTWGILLTVLIGTGIGVGAVIIWQMLDIRKTKPA